MIRISDLCQNGGCYLCRDGRRGWGSTRGGVFTSVVPSVKLSLTIRIVEADYLYIRSSFVNTHFGELHLFFTSL